MCFNATQVVMDLAVSEVSSVDIEERYWGTGDPSELDGGSGWN